MRHRDTVELYKYWSELRDGAAAPRRSAISPAALGRLLPSIMMLDRGADEETVFRLAGSRLCALHCAELKGKSVAKLFDTNDRTRLTKILDAVQGDNALVVLDVFARRPGGAGTAVEIALFPLDDERTRILGIASIATTPAWLGAVPAILELRGVRFMNTDARFTFLQSRPSVPVLRRQADQGEASPRNLRVIPGNGELGITRAIRAFRVVEGGKK